MSRATVIGCGSWGTALAIVLAGKGIPVRMWCRRPEQAEEMNIKRENSKYLPGITLPDAISVTNDLSEALQDTDYIVLAVPSQSLRETLEKIKDLVPAHAILINTAKGLEVGTKLRMSQVVESVLPGTADRFVALYGPSHAEEVGRGLPAAVVSCSVNAQAAEAEKILACNPDIVISEYEDVEKEDALQEQLGVPVITLKSGPAGVFADEFKDSMRLLGVIFGEEEKADALVAFVEQETAEISSRTADIDDADKPGVYICGLGNWGTTNHLMTSETYATFKVANIRNVVNGIGIKGIGEIEAEKFVALGDDMDIMVIDAAAVKNIKPLYGEDPTMFDTCKAWNNGEVYLEMAYNAYYTNYEIALANAWFLAKTAYPDRFEDIDMTAKLDEITDAFLGQNLAEDIYACGTSFGGYQKIDTTTFFAE